MSAKCASCHYPLTVSDSVVCRECRSYFHIDCAQLVGFPLFVLSGEPGKNTFHCSTCQLLPLPVARDDSSDDDEEMPSRQLDIALEGDIDLAKEMNEMKGGIQDLSDLCKDMLREINDLKSINLTLRCCVENLRHDNEQRDSVISELKIRIDLLEGKYFGRNLADSTVSTLDQPQEEEKEPDVYTPYELECTKITKSDNLSENIKYNHKSVETLEKTSTPKETYTLNEFKDEVIKEKENENFETNLYLNEKKQNENTETEYLHYKSNDEDEHVSKQDLVTSKEELNAEIVNETIQSKQDWSWRGNKAVELEKEVISNEEEDEESEAETETDDKDSQSWQKLEGEIDTLSKQDNNVAESLSEDEFWELQQDEKSEEKQELGKVRKSVRWDEGIADDESESEADWSQKETKEAEVEEQKDEEPSEVSEIEEEPHEDQEDLPNEGDVVGDLEGRLEADEEHLLESSKFAIEEDHLEINDGTSDVQVSLEHIEGLPNDEHRLEEVGTEETFPGEEGPRLEGEAGDNDDSRLEGEAKDNEECRLDIPELSEENEFQPPETPPGVHTEEDLWLYLKDTVSSVHPSTVQEFVQNLIGTLQHVPEEYLKPVIEANIRRVKTPSVTDGEHLRTPEDEEAVKEDCIENNVGPVEGDNFSSVEPQDIPRSGEIFTSATEEVSSQFPGGSSALEAAD